MGSECCLFLISFHHNLKCTSYFEDFFKIALAGKEPLGSFCFCLFSVTCNASGHSATVPPPPPHLPLKRFTRLMGPCWKMYFLFHHSSYLMLGSALVTQHFERQHTNLEVMVRIPPVAAISFLANLTSF